MKFNRKGNRIKEYMTTKDPNYTKDIDEIWDGLVKQANSRRPRIAKKQVRMVK